MSRSTEGPVILQTEAGPIQFSIVRSSRRKKTLELRVEPGGVVVVAAPVRTSTAVIERFVRARTGWVQDRIDTSGAGPDASLENGSAIPFRGRALTLVLNTSASKRSRIKRNGDDLIVSVPRAGLDEHIRPAVEQWLRGQALALVTDRVALRSAEMGVQPTGVRVTNQKRRWGSCSPTGVLRFNWRLAMVADEVLDYVVVHELAHLRHMNHSRDFWDFVAQFVPNHAELKRRLRTAGAGRTL